MPTSEPEHSDLARDFAKAGELLHSMTDYARSAVAVYLSASDPAEFLRIADIVTRGTGWSPSVVDAAHEEALAEQERRASEQ